MRIQKDKIHIKMSVVHIPANHYKSLMHTCSHFQSDYDSHFDAAWSLTTWPFNVYFYKLM